MMFILLSSLLAIPTSITLLLLCGYSAMLKVLLTMVSYILLVLPHTYQLMRMLTGLAAQILGDLPLDGVCFFGKLLVPRSARSKPLFQNLMLKQNIRQCHPLVLKLSSYTFFVNWVSLLVLLRLSMRTILVPPE